MKSMTAEQRNHMLLCDPVSSVIPKMAVPTIISMLITNIYNMADTFFVSQIGTSASGAVGVIFSAMAIIQAISFMIGMGSGTHVSQALGAGNKKKADTYASTAFFTAFIAGIILAFFSLTHIDFIVRFLGSTETIAPYAKDYATYIFYAMPFMMCSFVMNNLLRFEGLTMYGMVGITTGGILNMVLDPIFIFALNMGTAGAALATALSQGVSFIILLVMCNTKEDALSIKFSNLQAQPANLRQHPAITAFPLSAARASRASPPSCSTTRRACTATRRLRPCPSSAATRCSSILPSSASARASSRSAASPTAQASISACARPSGSA